MQSLYKVVIMIVIWSGISVSAYSQSVTTFNITYTGSNPSECNPFSTAANFMEAWKSSHGSPNMGDPYGQGFPKSARLVGGWPVGAAKEKGEGIFIAYDFKADHLYKITTSYAHGGGQDVGMDIRASNSVTEKSNSSCGEDELPTTSGDAEIYATNAIYDGLTGEISYNNSDFNPNGKSYKYLWFRARQYIYETSGIVLIDQVVIEDKGINPSAPSTPPATPQCPAKSLTDPVANKITIPGASQRGFGISVAADGQYFVVGAYREGKAYVYKKVGCDVQLMATLSGNYYFGYSVDIDGDQIVISEPPPTKGRGSVYLFRRYNEQWFPIATESMQIEQFGSSVAIEGNTVVIGSPYYTNSSGVITGRVIVYDIEAAALFPKAVFNGTVNFGGFGRSVDIKSNSLVVGSPYNDNSAYLFNRDENGVWNFAKGWHATKKTDDQDMGSNVALSEDGLHAFVGGGYVSGDNNGWVIMTFNKGSNGVWTDAGDIHSPWITPTANRACAVAQDILITTAWNSYVDVFRDVNNTRSRKTFIVQSGLPKDNFGASVAVGSDYFIIGAPEENPNCGYTGSVYLYDLFSMKDQTDHTICDKVYSGTIPDFGARTATIGATTTCGNVIYQNGANANYYANSITLNPGTSVLSGSSVHFQATGCLYGSNPASIAPVAAIAAIPSIAEEQPLLVEEIGETVVSAFPNPSPDGHIAIQTTHGAIRTIEIYSPQGLLIDTIRPGENEGNTIDVNLPSDGHGVYIIKTIVDNNLYIQKVVR